MAECKSPTGHVTLLTQPSRLTVIPFPNASKLGESAASVHMKLTFINQPFEGAGHRTGDHLTELLGRDADFERFRFAVAWVKRSGIQRIFEAMKEFRGKGGRIEAVVGIDLKGTSKQGLRLLADVAHSVTIFQNANRYQRPTCHPKLYVFSGPKVSSLILGSSNLTKGGLYTNYEHNVRLDLELSNGSDKCLLKDMLRGYETLANAPNGLARILTEELFQKLIDRGVLADEDAVTTKQTRTGDEDSEETKEALEPLFGTMTIEPPPSVSKPANQKPAAAATPVTQAASGQASSTASASAGSASVAASTSAIPKVLTMRPFPQRGGTQVQVPQELQAGYFHGIKYVKSQYDGREHPISPARTKSRSGQGRVVNTLKLEIPECKGKKIPIIQFQKTGSTIAYSAYDGATDVQGKVLWASLQGNLATGVAKQTRKDSTLWMLH